VKGFRKQEGASSWRRIALGTWSAPDDPTVYGLLEVDVTRALAFVARCRAETGVHVTLTHLVGRAVALAIRERPETNAVVRVGKRVYLRDTVDVFFQVAFEGGENLSGAKIRQADEKGVVQIAQELSDRAARIRAHQDRDLGRTHAMLRSMPGVVRRPVTRAAAFLTYDVGLDLRRWGLPFDAFGSAMVTNVGMFDLPVGLAPLVPFSHCPMLLTVGAIQDRPAAVDGRVEVRPMVTIGATFDHRLLDGYQAGRLARRFVQALEDPERHLDVGATLRSTLDAGSRLP
jgi:pyruvate/2-oxoglutarate dehydrogenase complex dihydrolipoamide acyltransferase (E2) component